MISLAVAVNYIMYPSSRLQSRINVFGACWICVFAANPIRNDKSSPQPRCVNTLSNAILVEVSGILIDEVLICASTFAIENVKSTD